MCEFCQNHEQGDTLYEPSDWDGGIGFDYIRDIKYCPLCGKKLNSEDEPTISKMEQVEPQTKDLFTDRYGDVWEWRGDAWYCISGDEPQTCSVNGRPYDCGNCEYHKCTAGEPQTERKE